MHRGLSTSIDPRTWSRSPRAPEYEPRLPYKFTRLDGRRLVACSADRTWSSRGAPSMSGELHQMFVDVQSTKSKNAFSSCPRRRTVDKRGDSGQLTRDKPAASCSVYRLSRLIDSVAHCNRWDLKSGRRRKSTEE
uniref:Uncharacterized protein n=1 Tax=Steinernema glaseri TaxID=37863 RepID=A0A1I8AW99_9BILA